METSEKRIAILSAGDACESARTALRLVNYRSGVGLVEVLALLDGAKARIESVIEAVEAEQPDAE